MGLDLSFLFWSLFCLSVFFVCIYKIQCKAYKLNYKLYYTFVLVLLFSSLFERWIMADQQDDLLKDSGEQPDRLDHVTLNIAVTGVTGAGKTSFVYAIRGLQEPDDGAAHTGVTKTTMEPTMYPHPTMPNVKIWDLPGIGSPTFKAETYMNDVKYQNYDFFIIVSASRFTENDMKLANEINENKKKFYFVRTKIDIDVTNENRKNVGEETTLEKIRKKYLENLGTFGSPPVFLMSTRYLERFDFQKLVNKLRDDLPDEKRKALVMSLPVYSKQSLDDKYSEFKKYAWALAITSGATAAIPVPRLATACDAFIVVSFLTKCYHSFGVDDGSLQKMSDRVNKPILEEVKQLGLVREIAIIKSLATSMVARLAAEFIVRSLYNLVPGAEVPGAGAAAVSVATTLPLLLEGVTELYRVAKIVLQMAEIP